MPGRRRSFAWIALWIVVAFLLSLIFFHVFQPPLRAHDAKSEPGATAPSGFVATPDERQQAPGSEWGYPGGIVSTPEIEDNPTVAPPAPVRFVVTGDTRNQNADDHNGVNTEILGEIAQATLNEKADFILVTGDLVYGAADVDLFKSELMTWRTTMQPLYDAGIGVYPVRGNHDAYNKDVWDAVFSGEYALPHNGPPGEENITYSFTYGNVFVAGLDQYVADLQINQAWLDEQLAANTQPHIFTFAHAPAFKVYHDDNMSDYPENRDAFWNSLIAAGSRVYFTGHDHSYDHARLDDGDGNPNNDVYQVLVGTGGAPLISAGNYDGDNGVWTPVNVYRESQYGYVLVEVNGYNVTITWKHRVSPGVYEPAGDVFTYSLLQSAAYIPLILR
jgi:hypothetical protein